MARQTAVRAATIVFFYGSLQPLNALSCWGTDALDSTVAEAHCSEAKAFANSMSLCLYQMAADVEETCTADSHCVTHSVVPLQSSFDNASSSQVGVYQFAGCYKRDTYANLCFDEQPFKLDPMPTDGTLSVEETTAAAAATRPSASTSASAASTTTTRPTTATTLSSTRTSTLYPNVGSCAYTAVKFARSTCVVGASARVRLINGTGGRMDARVVITSCCNDTDQCNNYGNRPEFSSWCYVCDGSEGAQGCDRMVTCAGDCWAYTTTKRIAGGGARNETVRGCGVSAAPVSWSSLTSQPPPSGCTASFQQPVCNATATGTVCFRCCTGYLCNHWSEVAVVATKKSLASGQDRTTVTPLTTTVMAAFLTMFIWFSKIRV